MPWLDEPDSYQPGLVNHCLYSGDAIETTLKEFWTRILTDAVSNAMVVPWKQIGFDILERQYEEDGQAYLHAAFVDTANKSCKGVSQYFLKSDHYTCLHDDDEDSQTFNKIQLEWYLQQYQLLKDQLNNPQLESLREKLEEVRPLVAHAATAFGWFDMQIGTPSFGPLSVNDQLALDGESTVRENPLMDLLPGPPSPSPAAAQSDEPPTFKAMQELASALVEQTPKHFEKFQCTITQGLQYGRRALFYKIECASFPDEASEEADETVQRAATALVKLMNPNDGLFPGLTISIERLANGNFKNTFEMLN